jgi:hypothetical protein
MNLSERDQAMIGEIAKAHDVNFHEAVKIALRREVEHLKRLASVLKIQL